ncbi:hypothetical protein KCP75_01560 [Salmonella enterica subsp. enterica]|nr:hypothetical protein KCP75_01560 [Salmonella enterica subsp. enterica]
MLIRWQGARWLVGQRGAPADERAEAKLMKTASWGWCLRRGHFETENDPDVKEEKGP